MGWFSCTAGGSLCVLQKYRNVYFLKCQILSLCLGVKIHKIGNGVNKETRTTQSQREDADNSPLNSPENMRRSKLGLGVWLKIRSMESFVLLFVTQQLIFVSANSSSRRLIVGGHNAERGRYPYFVALDYHNGVVLNGALIAPDFVLTAGHCLENDNEVVTLKVGIHSLSEDTLDMYDEVEIKRDIRHPDWSQEGESFSHDFLLFQLTSNSTQAYIKINRNESRPVPSQEVTMMGFGWTHAEYQSPVDVLQGATMTTMSNDNCAHFGEASPGRNYSELLDFTMLCTYGGVNNTRDGCAWDSGDPVILPSHDGNPAKDVLVGLGAFSLCFLAMLLG